MDLGATQERTEVASLVNLLRMVECGLEKGSKGETTMAHTYGSGPVTSTESLHLKTAFF